MSAAVRRRRLAGGAHLVRQGPVCPCRWGSLVRPPDSAASSGCPRAAISVEDPASSSSREARRPSDLRPSSVGGTGLEPVTSSVSGRSSSRQRSSRTASSQARTGTASGDVRRVRRCSRAVATTSATSGRHGRAACRPCVGRRYRGLTLDLAVRRKPVRIKSRAGPDRVSRWRRSEAGTWTDPRVGSLRSPVLAGVSGRR